MGIWSYQGIELKAEESPEALLGRIARLEQAMGRPSSFSAVGLFRAPILGNKPPRFSPKGTTRRFLHVAWESDSAFCWPILYHLALRDQRVVLSSFSGVGFYARDIDRDGHPREQVLLACFDANAEYFAQPKRPSQPADQRASGEAWRARLASLAEHLQGEGVNPERLARAEALVASPGTVRFDLGWFLQNDIWMSRYLVQTSDLPAIAIAQKALCTCASRYPETLHVVMPSDNCVHHLAARLVERLAEEALA